MFSKTAAVALTSLLLLAGAFGEVLHAQPSSGLLAPWTVVASGGSLGSTGASTQLSSTLGQPAIGPMGNAALRLHLGFWYPTYSTSSVKQDPINISNTAFVLRQNFPNPFNSSTTIAFSIPERSNIRIRVYNMLGNQVRELTNEVVEAGNREVIWNGQGDNGEPLSSGDYICEMEATPIGGVATTGSGNVVRQRQMMQLLK